MLPEYHYKLWPLSCMALLEKRGVLSGATIQL